MECSGMILQHDEQCASMMQHCKQHACHERKWCCVWFCRMATFLMYLSDVESGGETGENPPHGLHGLDHSQPHCFVYARCTRDAHTRNPHLHRCSTRRCVCMCAPDAAAFPSQFAKWLDPGIEASLNHTPSQCARGRVYTPARAGDAVLFYSYFPNR
jgi:hypothetical protein